MDLPGGLEELHRRPGGSPTEEAEVDTQDSRSRQPLDGLGCRQDRKVGEAYDLQGRFGPEDPIHGTVSPHPHGDEIHPEALGVLDDPSAGNSGLDGDGPGILCPGGVGDLPCHLPSQGLPPGLVEREQAKAERERHRLRCLAAEERVDGLIERLAERLQEASENLPDGIRAVPVYERTALVSEILSTVEHNLIFGALLVVAVLFVFLGNLRAGLIVAR